MAAGSPTGLTLRASLARMAVIEPKADPAPDQAAPAVSTTVIFKRRKPAVAAALPVFIRVGPPQPARTSGAPLADGTTLLRWKNGESLSGEIESASTDTVTWKTPLFGDPLEVAWSAIDRIESAQASVATSDPFSFTLRDGSFIFGDLVSIGGDSISIHSTRHGDVALKLSEVLSARRLHSKNVLFSGPTGDEGWAAMRAQQDGSVSRGSDSPNEVSPLETGSGGALDIRLWNRSAQLDLALPELIDVEFAVHSSLRPEFSLWLGQNFRQALRVETWDNELVLVAGDHFRIIRKIEENEREIALRICWDQKAENCSVYTLAGELLTQWQVPDKAAMVHQGIVLQNRGLDLSLDSLQVRTWDGKAPAKFDPKQPRVELSDGRTVGGAITGGPSGSIMLQSPGQSAPAPVSLHDVDALVFSTELPRMDGDHEATLHFADGTTVLGKLESIGNGHATVATSFTNQPLSSEMKLLRKMIIAAPTKESATATPLANLDEIIVQGQTLHGKLSSAGDAWPRWTPVGGTRATKISESIASEIVRAFPGDPPPASDPALFYLTSGDVLPGTLRSLDRAGAEFESTIMDSRKFSADELEAIQFAPPARQSVQGFNDPAWTIIKGTDKTVRRHDNTLEMDSGTMFGHPSLMQSSEISFKYASNGYSACRLRMFCAGSETSRSMNLLIGNTGGQLVLGLEADEGQFGNQVQVRTQPGQPVGVRLAISDNSVEVFINDVSTLQFPIDLAKCGGSGLIFEPAGMWGNGVFTVNLTDLATKVAPGRTWLPEVSSEIKSQVLTVPRFQKDDPPRHLLLAANGDVLRGEIEAATDTHFGFRCGMENLNVPRDRIKAVIWPRQPVKVPEGGVASAPDAPAKPAVDPLTQRIAGRMIFNGAGLDQVISFLQAQTQGLKFKLPETENMRRVQIRFGNETVAHALGRVSSLFGLDYRVASDGTIVLEPPAPGPAANGMVRKSYWLKPGTFAKDASVQAILAAKGLTFPNDASAEWNPRTNLLAVTDTPADQVKVEALLNSDFGGDLGSPTHWLLLVGGARLALTVDKFGEDFVVGHNPAYGSCKIPMSQVCVIRTSAPEATVASKALEDWQLVNAPEPVIPGSGGESSPLLGKDAPTFKVGLLDGGDFDLEANKGQVIVLDFWASWCGPCVKSLPGLIETVATFPSDRVKLIGVNQGETGEQVKRFLAARGLKFSIAMDADQAVGQKYGVDAIPHTVLVGPDGKVALVQTGYSPDGDGDISDAIKKLLQSPSASNTNPPSSPQ
jgi:peroxiredoxin